MTPTVNATGVMASLGRQGLLMLTRGRRSASAAKPSRSIRSPATFPARATARTRRTSIPTGRSSIPPFLRAEFGAVLDGVPPDQVVHHCGSGVTACHNILAMEVAGMHGTRLYPGSWSEWCADPARPVAVGP